MPDWKAEVRRRLRGLKLAPSQEAEIVEELAQHLEEVYEVCDTVSVLRHARHVVTAGLPCKRG